MKIKDLFEEYLLLAELGKPKDTVDGEIARARALFKAFDVLNLSEVEDLNTQSIIDIIKHFKVQGIKNSTIKSRIGLLYTVCNNANQANHLPKKPKLFDDTTPFQKIKDEDLKKILLFTKHRCDDDINLFKIKCAMYIMLETGVRVNELRHIEVSNIDVQQKKILLTKTKNRKKRRVPFSSLTTTIINDLIFLAGDNKYIFWNEEKNALWTQKKFHYWLSIVKKECGIKKLHCHQFRKTFATRLLEGGCSVTTIMNLLGHSSLVMTLIYLDITDPLTLQDYEAHPLEYNI